MKNIKYYITLCATILLLQSCSVVNYQLRDELDKVNYKTIGHCDVKYVLNIDGIKHFLHISNQKLKDDKLQQLKDKYLKETKNILNNMDCKHEHVKSKDGANLKIDILHQPLYSALGQEWLTGLSFGAIPSWGTRPAEAIFVLSNPKTKRKEKYVVDQKSYNHAALVPFIWVNAITDNKYDNYKEAVTDFIKNKRSDY